MSQIPERSHTLVRQRQRFMCLRCGGRGTDWHHRRKRNVKDRHQHCPCNGVLLCRTCHRWAHAHPALAVKTGFIVSSYENDPGAVPVVNSRGVTVTLRCDGTYGGETHGEHGDS